MGRGNNHSENGLCAKNGLYKNNKSFPKKSWRAVMCRREQKFWKFWGGADLKYSLAIGFLNQGLEKALGKAAHTETATMILVYIRRMESRF